MSVQDLIADVNVLAKLVDVLIEHPDENEPIYASAADWPSWTDESVAEMGPTIDPHGNFEPNSEDWKFYEDWFDRLETERRLGINARFV